MGIQDRDYYRDMQPRTTMRARGLKSFGLWSVNTWLIIICVVVFLLNENLPQRLVPATTYYPVASASQIDTSRPKYGRIVDAPVGVKQLRRNQGVPPNGKVIQVLASDKGPIIGYAEVRQTRLLTSYLAFSTDRMIYGIEFWRLLGFQFLHDNFAHLFMNMLGLFFFGPMVQEFLGSKRYLAFYLLCGICGALLYLLLNLGGIVVDQIFHRPYFPGLLFNDMSTPLVGASAGIFGVLMAGAYLAPNATAILMFIPMRLSTMAYVLLGLAVVTVLFNGNNAGGQAAHLGGAICGWYFIRRSHHLHDFFDILGRADPTSHHYRGGKSPRKAVSRSPFRQSDIDKILDKISSKGLQSLTEEEKRALQDFSGGR